jgi:hypothetical protein
MAPADASTRPDASNERANARTFHHSAYTPERIAATRERRGLSVAVCLPARECAGTIGQIVAALGELRERGALDRIVVVDAASPDGTAELAAQAGAEVWQEGELLASYGPVLGKGDAMWRALSALDSDVVCFLDADSERFSAHFAIGLLGALVCEPDVSFVKAFYRRPFAGDAPGAEQGGPAVRDRLWRGDRNADRRMARSGCAGDRPGRPGRAPQPPPAAVGAVADGADGARDDRAAPGARRTPDRGRRLSACPARAPAAGEPR